MVWLELRGRYPLLRCGAATDSFDRDQHGALRRDVRFDGRHHYARTFRQARRFPHRQRLDRVLERLEEPHTIAEVSQGLFGDVQGYNELLAIEEAGAHVEYLYQYGLLGVHNLAEVESHDEPVPIRYFRLKRNGM